MTHLYSRNVLRHREDGHGCGENHLYREENRFVNKFDSRCGEEDWIEIIEDCRRPNWASGIAHLKAGQEEDGPLVPKEVSRP